MGRNHLRRSPLQTPINSPEFIRSFVFNRAPTSDDYRNFRVSDLWIHRSPGIDAEYGYYVLVDTPNKSGKWVHLGAKEVIAVHDVVPDEGATVVPNSSGEIKIIGGSEGVTTSGDGNVLSLNVVGSLGDIETLTPDAGDPVIADVDGNIAVSGTDGIITSGEGSTLTITAVDVGVETLTGDTGGSVSPDVDGNINILGGSNVTVSGTTNTLTIDATGGGSAIPWTEVTTETQDMDVNHGYISNHANLVTLLLPSTAALGDFIKIAGTGIGSWKIAQNAGQKIHFLEYETKVGVDGSVTSTSDFSCVTCRCIATDNVWIVDSAVGNLLMEKLI